MKKKSFLKIGGAMLVMAIVLNIQYAWGDYGVKEHPLHLEVLAQSNDTGTNTGGDGDKGTGTGILWDKTTDDCSVTTRSAVGSVVTIFGVKLEVKGGGETTFFVSDASTSCETGGNEQCSSLSCGNFWIQYAQASGTPAANK